MFDDQPERVNASRRAIERITADVVQRTAREYLRRETAPCSSFSPRPRRAANETPGPGRMRGGPHGERRERPASKPPSSVARPERRDFALATAWR